MKPKLCNVTRRDQEPNSGEYPTTEGFIPVEGGRVWYEMSGVGGKTPLVFLHGGPGFPPYKFECLKQLADQRPVVLYHQLGCGKSDRPDDASLWTVDRFVEELNIVKEELGLQRLHLLGHSWGAALAAQYLKKFPEGVESVTLASPLLSTPKWIEDANRLKATLPHRVQEAIEANERDGTTGSDEYKKAMKQFEKRYLCRLSRLPKSAQRTTQEANFDVYETMWGPSEFFCTGNLKNLDCEQDLTNIKIPVLYTCGRYDEATPGTVASFKEITPGSQMVIFENSAHHAEIEEEPKFISTIRNFLNTVDGS